LRYAGRVGSDEHGVLYEEGLVGKGVTSSIGYGNGATGICLVLVTQDTERTMCTCLGCSLDLSPRDIKVDLLTASKYLYVTAYLWDTDGQKEAVEFAMSTAKKAGVKVCISLSDPFCVDRHKDELLQLISRHVDVVMGNLEEAQRLTDTRSPEDAARILAERAELAIVTMEKAGSLICSGGQITHIKAVETIAVDTTGAGDMYAAGILYGLTHGFELAKAGDLASEIAAKAVSKFGPRLETEDMLSALEAVERRWDSK